MDIVIHERVKKRHPDLNNVEIEEAINNTINWTQRNNHYGEILGIGVTKRGKFIEYVYMEYKDKLLVYHAQLATEKAFKELGLLDGGSHEDR